MRCACRYLPVPWYRAVLPHACPQIREKLVERANRWAELIQLGGRVHFAFCNATISMRTLLGSYPGQLDLVTVQFPDPHFKRKHRKRRTIQQNTARWGLAGAVGG